MNNKRTEEERGWLWASEIRKAGKEVASSKAPYRSVPERIRRIEGPTLKLVKASEKTSHLRSIVVVRPYGSTVTKNLTSASTQILTSKDTSILLG